jgi:DNA modification methylase
MINVNEIYNTDCVSGMKKLPNKSIDMILTSPPYDNLRNYSNNVGDKWNESLWRKVFNEMYRILKDGCVVVWVVGDATLDGSESGSSFKQALYARKIGFNLHDTMIYQKETPIPQFKVHRYTNSFEYMFIFSKGKPTRGALITEPTKQKGRIDRNYRGQVTADEVYVGKDIKIIKDQKKLTNIWTYSQNNGIDRSINHKAQFPEKLASDHIISWSDSGDIVLDPFMGSGTTAKMSLLNNRNFLGFEINTEYCRIIKDRIKSYEKNTTFK